MLADKNNAPKQDTDTASSPGDTGTQKDTASAKDASQEKCNSKPNGHSPETSSAKADPEALQQALEKEKDRCLRMIAEFENYKKRTAREIADFRKFANESVFKQLLTVLDNLERAIASGETQTDSDGILQGVQLTHKELLKLFEAFKVAPVEAEGKPFDPNLHQAVTHQESDQHPDNTVINELQKGYVLHDRLLRPSMVVVSKTARKVTPETENNTTDSN